MFNPEDCKKLAAGGRWVGVTIRNEGDTLRLRFPYNPALLAEIKAMSSSRWDADTKTWTVAHNDRNLFQLAFLAGEDVYDWWDQPLIPEPSFERPLYSHQRLLVRSALTHRYVLWAAEQGTGKSLAIIETMERSGFDDWFYVAPRSAIASFEVELERWDSKVKPTIVTYDSLGKVIRNWERGKAAPPGVICDESSRLKNPTAKRTQYAMHLADSVRRDWGKEGFVILMTGTPAPKAPTDWWAQCEIVQPGFLKEGTWEKFKQRLSLSVMKESFDGGTYPHHVTWLDDPSKCLKCGLKEEEHVFEGYEPDYHPFAPSKDEVSYLSERLKGLTVPVFKKDVLKELPEKRYRVVECEPSKETLRAAKLIVATSPSAAVANILLRELSDGFQYTSVENGTKACPTCSGDRKFDQPVPILDLDEIDARMTELTLEAEAEGKILVDPEGLPIPEHLLLPDAYRWESLPCPECGGEGEVIAYTRAADEVPCPKDKALRDILDHHEDRGRLVIFGGFNGSIDRIIRLVESMQWEWIRVDGRGWKASPALGLKGTTALLKAFQHGQEQFPRIAFVAHPTSAGMGLTLTAACESVYFSNDYNGESRLQSEDRIHRPGIDLNKGALITDLFHLPSDRLVLENLKKKKHLQGLTLGMLKDAFEVN